MGETLILKVWVDGLPVSQPRTKHRPVKTKAGKTFTMTYTPKVADTWKATVRIAVSQAYRGPVYENREPLRVDMDFFFPRPSRLLRARDPEDCIPHTAKPDKDNLEKAVLDSLQGGPIWKDDQQVFSGCTSKYYTRKGGRSGMMLTVYRVVAAVE